MFIGRMMFFWFAVEVEKELFLRVECFITRNIIVFVSFGFTLQVSSYLNGG